MTTATTRLKNALRRLPDYWWLVHLIWLIALVCGIVWLIWTAPSVTERYFYAGIIGPIVTILLIVIVIGALPLAIILNVLKHRKLSGLIGMILGNGLIVLIAMALTGPILGQFFEYSTKADDRVSLNGNTYILSHEQFKGESLDDGRTFYLLRCKGLFKHCQTLVHLRDHSYIVGSDNIPTSKLSVDGDTISIVIDDEIVYVHHPD